MVSVLNENLKVRLTIKALVPPFSADASPLPVPNLASQQLLSQDGFPYQDYLPATYCSAQTGSFLSVNPGNIPMVLRQDMLVPKLNMVHDYLWWCKKPREISPLHEQAMDHHEIVVTEQVDLHLVCPTRRIFVKPLPPYLLCHEFWTAYICADAELHECCVGFLLSYALRIRHKSDLALAAKHHLISEEITWKTWTVFVDSLLSYIESRGGAWRCINKRYLYGELKLTRLNVVSRYCRESPGIHGYLSGYGQAGMFFKRNFAWMGLGFLYLVAILTAMQVGLAAKPLQDNAGFNWASYGFAVFCILLPVTIVVVHLLRHVGAFIIFSSGMMRKSYDSTRDRKQSA